MTHEDSKVCSYSQIFMKNVNTSIQTVAHFYFPLSASLFFLQASVRIGHRNSVSLSYSWTDINVFLNYHILVSQNEIMKRAKAQ